MKKALCASLRQAMLSRGFLIGASGTALVLLLSSVQGILSGFRSAELLSPGFHSDLIMGALSSDAMALALPILCALPYTASFIDDVKNGFIKEYLPRTTVSRYIAGKAVGCAVSGGLVLALGIFIAYGFAALLFLPMARRMASLSSAMSAWSWMAIKCQGCLLLALGASIPARRMASSASREICWSLYLRMLRRPSMASIISGMA